MSGKIYGIDLGTTNSAIALYENGEARILKNLDGGESTPSAVFFTGVGPEGGDEILVGEQAKNAAAAAPQNVMQFVKRLMGSKGAAYNFRSPGGTEYTPEMISSLILKKVCQDAMQYNGGEPVEDVVITVPAYFDDARRTATRQAGKIAGLNVLRVINEPTAAAISFGVDTSKNGSVLVYDLGGGTFDVTIMDISRGNFDVLATGGDSQLGGINFDQKLIGLILRKLSDRGVRVDEDDDVLMADIREKAEKTKIQLSSVEHSRPVFSVNGRPCRIDISREEFESEAQPLMQRTRLIVEEVMASAGVGWEDIDTPILIGGSTKMPLVRKTLEALSGKTLAYTVDPDTAVAQGAAIFAATLMENRPAPGSSPDTALMPYGGISGELVISDVTSQSLGVVTVDSDSRTKRVNTVIIPANTKIPARCGKTVYTVVDGQTSILVEVTEGNDPELEFVKIIGSTPLTMPPYPKNSPVEIIFAYDPDQTIYIEVIDKVTGSRIGTFEVERTSNMSAQAVSDAVTVVDQVLVD